MRAVLVCISVILPFSLSAVTIKSDLECVKNAEPMSLNDIQYWDIDHVKNNPSLEERNSMKAAIVEELLSAPSERFYENEDGEKVCLCSKIHGPIICDQFGNRHTNVCQFICARTKSSCKAPLLPVKVFIMNENGQGDLCK